MPRTLGHQGGGVTGLHRGRGAGTGAWGQGPSAMGPGGTGAGAQGEGQEAVAHRGHGVRGTKGMRHVKSKARGMKGLPRPAPPRTPGSACSRNP